MKSTDPKIQSTISGHRTYFGFPITRLGHATASGFLKDPSFDYYTASKISQLPASKLPEHGLLVDKPLCSGDLPAICFPWAIVESYGPSIEDKPNDTLFAALSGSRVIEVLTVLESLAKFADEKHNSQHIPPVIIITSIGSEIIARLAYLEVIDERREPCVELSSPHY
jgi:hypothetical protein